MSDWSESCRVRRHPRAVWRQFDREVAIIVPWDGAIRTLTEVGARAWALADGREFGDIVEQVTGEFEVELEVAASDLRAFFAELEDKKLVLIEPGSSDG